MTTGAQAVGVVLGAGASSRMGQPKLLLELAGRTLLERCVQALLDGGVARVAVVTRNELADPAAACLAALGWASRVQLRINPDPDRGQLSSLWIGLDAAEQADAMVLLPVDSGGVAPQSVRAVLAARQAGAVAASASYRGRAGHPALFGHQLFGLLRQAPLDQGARWIYQQPEVVRRLVEVDDPAVVQNLNRPEDLAAWLAGAWEA